MVGFNGISTFVGYLMPIPIYIYNLLSSSSLCILQLNGCKNSEFVPYSNLLKSILFHFASTSLLFKNKQKICLNKINGILIYWSQILIRIIELYTWNIKLAVSKIYL